MMFTRFIRTHTVGVLALVVALGGTAVAAGPIAQSSKTQTKVRQRQLPLTSASGSSSATVNCKPGEKVTGGGYRFGTPLDLSNTLVVLNAPIAGKAWQVDVTTIDATAWNGAVTAYAVCATG